MHHKALGLLVHRGNIFVQNGIIMDPAVGFKIIVQIVQHIADIQLGYQYLVSRTVFGVDEDVFYIIIRAQAPFGVGRGAAGTEHACNQEQCQKNGEYFSIFDVSPHGFHLIPP